METTSRREAKEQKLLYYFTGRPCINGHVDKRFLSSGTCVICHAETGKQKTAKEGRKRRYAADETQAAGYKERAKTWRIANPEQYRENQRRWREANKEKVKEIIAKWATDNPERFAEINRNRNINRHARKRAAGKTTAADARQVLAAGKCARCGETDLLEIDHIVSLKRGGRNHLSNLQLLCRPCNRRKAAK